jgi:hypothetical protein
MASHGRQRSLPSCWWLRTSVTEAPLGMSRSLLNFETRVAARGSRYAPPREVASLGRVGCHATKLAPDVSRFVRERSLLGGKRECRERQTGKTTEGAGAASQCRKLRLDSYK